MPIVNLAPNDDPEKNKKNIENATEALLKAQKSRDDFKADLRKLITYWPGSPPISVSHEAYIDTLLIMLEEYVCDLIDIKLIEKGRP